ncbi:unnamed protein product [Cylicostephanus goldi]|uniref:Uncharacterized protein n=1 Tax=Cylicostephanus goldi TaxID=71465 RepID=A0A3P6SBI0_CYLGO|nr:unnamed protein product [Cylicostephanus goldi]
MASMFDDILSRAEKLSSANFHATLADPSTTKKNNNALFEGNASQENRYSGTAFDTDLNSVFRASEHLWKTGASAPIQKSFIFGEKGVVFGVKAPTLKEARVVPKPAEDQETKTWNVSDWSPTGPSSTTCFFQGLNRAQHFQSNSFLK